MTRCALFVFLTMAGTLLAQPARVPEIPYRSVAWVFETARGYVFGRGRRGCG